jgi:hypothetical protein
LPPFILFACIAAFLMMYIADGVLRYWDETPKWQGGPEWLLRGAPVLISIVWIVAFWRYTVGVIRDNLTQ